MTLNPADDTRLVWSPKPALVTFGWLLAVAALAVTVFTATPEGRILGALATIGLALYALFGTLARPRLAADHDGLVVRRLGGERRWAWSEVRIQVTRSRRFGRSQALLELDALDEEGGENLVVLGWLDLGTDADEVADALRELRR
jgi:hypothetical protein